MKDSRWDTHGILLTLATVALCGGIILTGHLLGKRKEEPMALTCAIATPDGLVGTVSGDVTNPEITDFGVVKAKDFTYTPASGELCIITSRGANP